MPRFVGTVCTPKAREEAFDYLADFSSVAQWDPTVTEARKLDEGPPALGTRFRVVVRALGRETPYTYEIVELRRPELVRLRAETSAVISLDTITFAGGAAGTEVTYDAELRLKGAMRLLALPMRFGFDRLAENAKAGLERELGSRRGAGR
jgi:hypothetical protein